MIADPRRMHPQAVRHASSAALIIIGVIALYSWVLAPHVGNLRAMQKLEAAVDAVVEERDRIGETLDAKIHQRRSLQQELAELEAGVFTPSGKKAFLCGLLPLAEETGCTVLAADFAGDDKTTRTEEPNEPLRVEISHPSLVVSGPCDRVLVLLQRLQDSRPRAWIDSCRCDFSNGGAGPVECHLVLALYAVENRRPPGDP